MSKKVVIIDDNQTLLSIMRDIIRTSGYEVQTFDYVTFTNFIDDLNPDYILLDVWFGQEKMGLKLASAIKNHDRLGYVPLILMSSDPAIRSYAKELNISMYLEKPLDMEKLLRFLKHPSEQPHTYASL